MKAIPTLLLFFLLLSTMFSLVSAEEIRIEVWPPPSRRFPLKIYVSPSDLDLETGNRFVCEYHNRISVIFYQVVRELPRSILRFVDEHPEYRELLQIWFMNASSEKQADVVLRIVRGVNRSRAYISYMENSKTGIKPYELQIVCWEGNLSEVQLHNIILHEFLHTLGVGHANTLWTSEHDPEVMLNIAKSVKQYPTSLDLYALYMTLFGELDYRSDHVYVELPNDLGYEMIVPYDVELQRLKEENQRLRTEVEEQYETIADLKHQIEEKDLEIIRLGEEARALQRNVSVLLEVIRDYSEANEECVNLYNSLRKNYTDLAEEYQILYGNFSEVVDLLNRTYHQKVEWKNKYAELARKYNQVVEKYNQLAEACRQLSDDFERFRKMIIVINSTAIVALLIYLYLLRRERS